MQKRKDLNLAKTHAKKVDVAHEHQHKILKRRRKIEMFMPLTASFFFLFVVLGISAHFTIKYFTGTPTAPEQKIETKLGTDSLQVQASLQNLISRVNILNVSDILYGNYSLGKTEKYKFYKFYPSQISGINAINTADIIASRSIDDTHLLSLSLAQNEEIYRLMEVDIRTEALKVPESSRRLFVNNFIKELDTLYTNATLATEAMNAQINNLKSDYDALGSQISALQDNYNAAYKSFAGNEVELAAKQIAETSAQRSITKTALDALNQNYKRLLNNKEVLKKRQTAIEKNIEPLVAGVQVEISNNQNLGLIKN